MTVDDVQVAQHLAGQAHQVGRASGREPWRELLQWITRGWLGRRRGWPVVPVLGTPWQDTISAERTGPNISGRSRKHMDRALAEHEKAQAYPEAAEQARAEFAELHSGTG